MCFKRINMINIQDILVFITVGIAVAYLIKKYVLPKPIATKFFGKKKSSKNCGHNDCGCH